LHQSRHDSILAEKGRKTLEKKNSTSCVDFYEEECTVKNHEKTTNDLSEEAALKLPFGANSLINTAL